MGAEELDALEDAGDDFVQFIAVQVILHLQTLRGCTVRVHAFHPDLVCNDRQITEVGKRLLNLRQYAAQRSLGDDLDHLLFTSSLKYSSHSSCKAVVVLLTYHSYVLTAPTSSYSVSICWRDDNDVVTASRTSCVLSAATSKRSIN